MRTRHDRIDAAAARIAAAGVATRTATGVDAVDGVVPRIVAAPTTTEEVAAVMRAAAEDGLTVVPRGAGTKLTWGNPPSRVDVVIDLLGLDRILDHTSGDLVVVTEAGVRLADLQRHVRRAGQHLALDETTTGATVGGVVATGSSGPQRLIRGTVRDLLIGVTFVRADGRVVHAGGRVVKNVAGYDLGKLLVGSYGTLGVVTEAIFRLHPLPAARQVVRIELGTGAGPSEVHRLVARLVGTQTAPSAIELDWPHGSPPTLTVLFEGSSAGVGVRAATVADLTAVRTTTGVDLPTWWARYPWTDDRVAAHDVALKLTFAISGGADVLEAVQDLRGHHGLPVAVRGSIGVGVLYAAIEPGAPPSDDTASLIAAAVERLRAVCLRHGGAAVVVDAPAALGAQTDRWGPVAGLALMRRVKDEFDPTHRLAPGRYVGGI